MSRGVLGQVVVFLGWLCIYSHGSNNVVSPRPDDGINFLEEHPSGLKIARPNDRCFRVVIAWSNERFTLSQSVSLPGCPEGMDSHW